MMKTMNSRSFATCTRNYTKLKKTKGRSTSSQIWLARHVNDPYVQNAQVLHYRCRSAFKLIEIDDKYRILKPGMAVVDCGAAPGSWSQVAVDRVNALASVSEQPRGKVISSDLLHIAPLDGITNLQYSDFTKPETQQKILDFLSPNKTDVILSDMAPNATGLHSMDTELIVDLCFFVLRFAERILHPGGALLCKIWQGGEQQGLENHMKRLFETVKVCKPSASRKDSSELFLLGRGYRT